MLAWPLRMAGDLALADSEKLLSQTTAELRHPSRFAKGGYLWVLHSEEASGYWQVALKLSWETVKVPLALKVRCSVSCTR